MTEIINTMQVINTTNWIVIIENAGLWSPPITIQSLSLIVKLHDKYSNLNEGGLGWVGLEMENM